MLPKHALLRLGAQHTMLLQLYLLLILPRLLLLFTLLCCLGLRLAESLVECLLLFINRSFGDLLLSLLLVLLTMLARDVTLVK